MQLDRNQQLSVWYVLAAFLVLLAVQSYLGGHSENLPYSDFKKVLAAGQLEALRRTGDGRHAFVTTRVEDDLLVTDLERAGVTYEGRVESRWLGSLVSMVVWIAVFFGIWTFAMRRMHGPGPALR